MADRYIVATESAPLSNHQAAKLYRLTGYRQRAVLAGSGSLGQMQDLANELNGETDAH